MCYENPGVPSLYNAHASIKITERKTPYMKIVALSYYESSRLFQAIYPVATSRIWKLAHDINYRMMRGDIIVVSGSPYGIKRDAARIFCLALHDLHSEEYVQCWNDQLRDIRGSQIYLLDPEYHKENMIREMIDDTWSISLLMRHLRSLIGRVSSEIIKPFYDENSENIDDYIRALVDSIKVGVCYTQLDTCIDLIRTVKPEEWNME